MDDFLRVTALLLFGSPILAAYFLVVAALAPRRVARTQAALEASPGRAFVIGLINLVFLATVGLALLSMGESTGGLLALPGIVCMALLAAGVTLGLAGVVQLVGARLVPGRGLLGRGVAGGLAVSLACALPVLGWFLLLPVVAMLGLGAFVVSYLYTPAARSESAAGVAAGMMRGEPS